MGELTSLPNIAAKMEAQLADIGITTIEQLKEIGSREAWIRILARVRPLVLTDSADWRA